MKEIKQTYHEMVIAVILVGTLLMITGALLTKEYIVFPAGVMVGLAIAVWVLSHMMKSVCTVVELETETAKRYGTRQSIIRISVMGIMLCAACFYSEYVSPWGVLLGLFTVKVSAYLQKPIHLFIQKYIKHESEDSDMDPE